MNPVDRYKSEIQRSNYVRRARPNHGRYFFDWACKKIEQLRQDRGDQFFLIIYGMDKSEQDFYVIPFAAVKHILTDHTVTNDKSSSGKLRWTGTIQENLLRIDHSDSQVNLTSYYGNHLLLEKARGRLGSN
jgi:hypothetical protein